MSKHLVVLLDESGSMNEIRSEIIDGMNVFIHQQRQVESEKNHQIKFTLVKFNSTVKEPKHLTLDKVPPMTQNDYIPGGMTSLYDAIGMTFGRMQTEKNVVAVIVTDGIENSSYKFKRSHIMELIRRLEEKNNWKFVYLSSDIDTWNQGNNINLSNNTVFGFNECTGKHEYQGSRQNQVVSKAKLGSFLSSGAHNKCVADFRKQYSFK